MPTSSRRNRMRNRVDAAASPPSLAVFAAIVATFAAIIAVFATIVAVFAAILPRISNGKAGKPA